MRFFLYTLLTISSTLACAQSSLEIKGYAPLLKNGTEISLEEVVPKRLAGLNNLGITIIKNHIFKFIMPVDGAELYVLSANNIRKWLFLNPGKTNITVDDSSLRKVTVSDNLADFQYNSYQSILDTVSLFTKYGRARVDYDVYIRGRNVDTALANSKVNNRDSLLLMLHKQLLGIALDWIKKFPDSYINTSILYDQIEYMPEDEIKSIYNSMPVAVKKNIWAKELKYRIDSLFIGSKAPFFSQADTNGRQVSITSYHGKYVLVDFWASWCLPCRAENPNVVKAMQKFKDKNFAVVGISLDEKKEAWLKAINRDGLCWTNLSSLQAWKNPVAIKYYVLSIPGNYLIGPEGQIIAKNLYGNDLITTLNKLFK